MLLNGWLLKGKHLVDLEELIKENEAKQKRNVKKKKKKRKEEKEATESEDKKEEGR